VNRFLNALFIICGSLNAYSQVPSVEWQKCYGGSDIDVAWDITSTLDGGYILACSSNSINGDVSVNNGNGDAWVVKIDANGNIEWQKCFGGSMFDGANSIIQTKDSGYIFIGNTNSDDGNISGHHGVGCINSSCSDYWVVKMDNIGNLQWQKCLGGTFRDVGKDILQTWDNGYIVSGLSESNDGDVDSCAPGMNYWIVKLDELGSIQWNHCYKGFNTGPNEICQTHDSGFVIIGKVDIPGHGIYDAWVVKADSLGNLQWQKSYGGTCLEEGLSIQETRDMGYIMAGYTFSNDYDVSGNHDTACMNGPSDFWVVKTDGAGNLQKQKCLGGSQEDEAYSIKQTLDGNYIVVGFATSFDGDVTGNHYYDYWVIKLDTNLNIIWQKCLGGGAEDQPNAIIQTNDSGYLVAGNTLSNDGDVNGNHGNYDAWVVKLSSDLTGIFSVPDSNIELNADFNQESGNLFVNFCSKGKGYGQIQLLDVSGRVLLMKQVETTNGFNKQQLNALNLSRGVYLVRLTTAGGVVTKKLIAE
jgi:hypothetical protein